MAEGLYKCQSDSGEEYMCDVINKTCNCKRFYYNKVPCKHLKALGVD